ncbi:pyridoxal 5'-phosphate synthase glutaminase subunit PdxT [Clostridium sp. DJ247]|uniref:pyridoxal 5'-phosphate synthase glutaminase subunit PdxT n=1 Tax=Clostridium sp. DJ247 TaxID=2726188 RepID=UPI001629D660|nr:pyridoxal 5'-phosphate synthase glutaminase subunit PdxT [Clostridium sp. DJ247]MBC2579456.1 pyridoxal 5'-phosphate synthase glutaminase subunit PdxT [Clostridium sp. DJ247]
MKIGVLSLQGGVAEHINHIQALGCTALEVKKLEDLEDLNGLILPGGESTTIGKILKERNILIPLREKILSGLPVWGTCAGMILLAKELENDGTTHLSVMDIKVRRNAYGTQIDSFETTEIIEEISSIPIPLVFIRAPYIVDSGDNVKILHRVNGNIVAARQDNILVTSFHPELTKNLELHRYFISMCSN